MNNLVAKLKGLFFFYYDGFRSMSSWGRQVWLVIFIKLFIIFILLRIFFFPDFLKVNFRNDSDRSNYVRNQILNTK